MATFAQASTTTTGFSATTAHNTTANVSATSNGIGFYVLERNDGAATTDVWTTVTWGGVAMTPITTQITSGGTRCLKVYYVLNPASGASVAINATSSININSTTWWMTIQDAKQQAPEAFNTAATTSATVGTVAVTTLTANALVVGFGSYIAPASLTPAAGTTNRMNASNVWVSWTSPQATAGSNTSGNTFTGATDERMLVASFADIGGVASNSRFLAFM